MTRFQKRIVEPRTAGDPMQEQLDWTDLCMAEISDELAQRGTPISPPTVKKLLNENGFSKPQILKSIAGGSVPERNEQFELIAELQSSYRSAKNPIFSSDTKKKELLGTLYRAGRVYSQEAFQAFDHDFPSFAGDSNLSGCLVRLAGDGRSADEKNGDQDRFEYNRSRHEESLRNGENGLPRLSKPSTD